MIPMPDTCLQIIEYDEGRLDQLRAHWEICDKVLALSRSHFNVGLHINIM